MTAAGGTFTHPEYLVSTDWLATHLGDADLRVFDCTTILVPDPATTFLAESGRPQWAEGMVKRSPLVVSESSPWRSR